MFPRTFKRDKVEILGQYHAKYASSTLKSVKKKDSKLNIHQQNRNDQIKHEDCSYKAISFQNS